MALALTEKAPLPPAIRFVLMTALINAIGFGIIVPVTPKMLMSLGHIGLADATAIGGWLSFTYAASQFLFSPLIGNLSDRFGRRPVLLASVFGFAIDFIVFAFAPSLAWVFVVRALAGMFGASNGPAQSVIADLIAPEDRARYFGMLSAAFGIGFVLGPALGGLLGQFDYRLPFLVAGALTALVGLYGWLTLPETLAPEHRRRFEPARANPFGALLRARAMPGILPIAAVYLLWQVATLVYPMTWSFFTMGRYGWSEGAVGGSLAVVGLTIAWTQMLVLPKFVRRFGEWKTAILGISFASFAMFGLAFAPFGWLALILILPMAMQSMVHPNLTAMMTRAGTVSTQGEVQGFASSVMAIGSLIAPLLFNPIQAWFTGADAPIHFYGAAYLVAGIIALSCIPVLAIVKRAGLSGQATPAA